MASRGFNLQLAFRVSAISLIGGGEIGLRIGHSLQGILVQRRPLASCGWEYNILIVWPNFINSNLDNSKPYKIQSKRLARSENLNKT